MSEQSDVSEGGAAELWFEAACGLLTLDPALNVLAANPTALALLDRPAGQILGMPFTLYLSELDRERFARMAQICFEGADETGLLEFSVGRPAAPPLPVDAQIRVSRRRETLQIALFTADKRRSRQEFMQRKLKEAELAASIVAASNDAIFSLSADGRVLSWNHGAEELYGYSAAEAIGQSLDFLVPEDKRAESTTRVHSVFAGNNVYFETDRMHKSGALTPVAISGGPIYDDQGRVVGIATVHRDIRAQVRHEAQLRFVMRELAHRTKNLLAIIQSIERQTARGVTTTEEFHERFSSRLQALAASHDLLVETNWGGARIGDLIERQLAAFSDQIGSRILLSGPPMRLSPSVAQTIGLALHELATNATKYGALSIPSGQVNVTWGVYSTEGGKRRFRIEWRESGGPAVNPPIKRGFGSLAIERLAAQALNGEAELIFAEDGLHWTLSSDPSYVEEAE